MKEEKRCQDCGSRLAEELDGACPACLWGDSLPEDTDGLAIGEEIARGGMGIVYRAWQAEPNRAVAAKMLIPHLLDEPGLRERFANEARAAAALDHPGILPVYTVGERGGVPYFTMKLAEGGSLADRLRGRGALPAREAATLAAEVSEAIAHAHSRGVLHRDVKPANILFNSMGRACVSDFGLAKVVDVGNDTALTRTASLLGTLHYLPPEIARGSLREASTVGDIYSIGATLHELLTGQPPFQADSGPALLRQIADGAPSPLVDFPNDLTAIVAKCMDKNPAKRYATAGALAEDLRAWLDGRPVSARHPTAPERLWQWMRQHPTMAALGLALTGSLILGSWLQHKANARLSESLAESLISNASAERQRIDGGARMRTLELIRRSLSTQAPTTPERSARLRSESASALARPGLDGIDQWPIFGLWNHVSPGFTPDLRAYAAPTEDGGFAIWETDTRTMIRAFPPSSATPSPPVRFRFNATGHYVVVTFVDMDQWQAQSEIHASDGSSQRGPFRISGVDSAVPVVFADGSFIAVEEDGACWHWPSNVAGRGQPIHLTSDKGSLLVTTLSLSHDGTKLAGAISEPNGLALWNVADQRLLWRTELTVSPRLLTWSPDGRQLACSEGSSSIVILDALSGKISARHPGHRSSIDSIAFHPSGDSIASVAYDGWLLWQGTFQGAFRTRTLANPGPLVFSHDGKQLAFSPARGTLGMARISLPLGWTCWTPVRQDPSAVTCAESSRDGRLLAVATLKGMKLWNAETRKQVDFRAWEAEVRWPWFRVSPTGTELVCSDSGMPPTRWPISDKGFGEPVAVQAEDRTTHIIHDFSASGTDWLVSGDRIQRETSSQTNFYIWPNGDPNRARLIAEGVIAVGLSFVAPQTRHAVGYHSHLPDARVWDCETAQELRRLGHDEPIYLTVSPVGGRACTIGAKEGRLWATHDWSLIAAWDQHMLGKAIPQFSPKGTYVATMTPSGKVSIRLAHDGTPFLELDPPVDVAAALFVWLGETKLLLVSSEDGLYEWDLTQLRQAADDQGIPW